MKVPAKFRPGDKVQVLIGRRWLRCVVREVSWWTTASAVIRPAYRVEITRTGESLVCGHGILRVRPPRRPKSPYPL